MAARPSRPVQLARLSKRTRNLLARPWRRLRQQATTLVVSPRIEASPRPRIGDINGATNMAPMIVATESISKPKVAIIAGPRNIFVDRSDRRINGVPAKWAEGGVKILGTETDSPVLPIEEHAYQAALASRMGWKPYPALKGITRATAKSGMIDDRVGSVGKPAPGMKAVLVRYDVERDEHLRDAAGRLELCVEEEVGELLGKISTGRSTAGRFEGYTSKEASEKKVLHDVVRPGDAWFRTGDLMRRDADGYYFFVDRIGDTFRWKGENVSTQEVADAAGALDSVELCAAYGVSLPNADGRVGMLAARLHDDADFDGAGLYALMERALPAYARPAFVRLLDAHDLTGTFKIRKVALQREGFDPKEISDPLYYRDDSACSFLPLGPEVADRIRAGALRF